MVRQFCTAGHFRRATFLVSGKLERWSLWHRNVLVKQVSRGIWTQERLARLRGWEDDRCQLCHDSPGTVFHRCCECPALQTERDMHVSQDVRQAARSLAPQYREQFAKGSFPCPSAILPTGPLQQSCPVLWHTRPPDGILEGHIFQDGSSAGSGALRRAGWAVVAVDHAGGLKAAAYGAVPSDVLPGQISRDGEDYAAAEAGNISRCISTVKVPSRRSTGQSARLWEQGVPEHTSGAGILVPHQEVKAIKVKGHDTQRDVEAGRSSHVSKSGNDFADVFAKKGADTHKPAFRVAKTAVACASLAKQAARWAAEAHVLLRYRGCRAKSTDTHAVAHRDEDARAERRCDVQNGQAMEIKW